MSDALTGQWAPAKLLARMDGRCDLAGVTRAPLQKRPRVFAPRVLTFTLLPSMHPHLNGSRSPAEDRVQVFELRRGRLGRVPQLALAFLAGLRLDRGVFRLGNTDQVDWSALRT